LLIIGLRIKKAKLVRFTNMNSIAHFYDIVKLYAGEFNDQVQHLGKDKAAYEFVGMLCTYRSFDAVDYWMHVFMGDSG